MSSARLRPVFVGLTIVLLVLAAIEAVILFRIIDSQDAVGVDLVYYQDVARRGRPGAGSRPACTTRTGS